MTCFRGRLGRVQPRSRARRAIGATALMASLLSFAATPGVASAADTTSPSLSWKSPTAAMRVSGVLQGTGCLVSASDAGGIARVKFYADGTALNTEYYSPYNCYVDTRRFADGTHLLKAVAYDRAGNATSRTIQVVVDNVPDDTTPPTVSWAAPASGATVSGIVTSSACEAKASDTGGISRVTFAIDGTALNTEQSAPYNCTFDTTKVSDGAHTLKATAFDRAGNSAAATIQVTVRNASAQPAPAPSVKSVTRPVGSPVLSDADAASRVRRSSW